MFYYDWTYILVLVGAVIVLAAQARVKGTFNKYSKIQSRTGMTGEETARRMLNYAGIYDVTIERINGNLTDNYDSSTKTLHLSDSTFGATSVAAVGVAAHECGHALQHAEGYNPLKIRSVLFPAANIGSKFGIPIVILGLFLGYNPILMQIGIWAFSIGVLFQLVTLPVEFNASARAVKLLDNYGILAGEEIVGCKKVLNAAALTYVAAAAAAVLQLLRLVLLSGRRRD